MDKVALSGKVIPLTCGMTCCKEMGIPSAVTIEPGEWLSSRINKFPFTFVPSPLITTAFARSSAVTIAVVVDICSLFATGGDEVELDGTELVIDCTTDDDDDDAPPGGEALIVAV